MSPSKSANTASLAPRVLSRPSAARTAGSIALVAVSCSSINRTGERGPLQGSNLKMQAQQGNRGATPRTGKPSSHGNHCICLTSVSRGNLLCSLVGTLTGCGGGATQSTVHCYVESKSRRTRMHVDFVLQSMYFHRGTPELPSNTVSERCNAQWHRLLYTFSKK